MGLHVTQGFRNNGQIIIFLSLPIPYFIFNTAQCVKGKHPIPVLAVPLAKKISKVTKALVLVPYELTNTYMVLDFTDRMIIAKTTC